MVYNFRHLVVCSSALFELYSVVFLNLSRALMHLASLRPPLHFQSFCLYVVLFLTHFSILIAILSHLLVFPSPPFAFNISSLSF